MLTLIPDDIWKLLFYGYEKMEVYIHFNNKCSEPIKIKKGTKQGGMSSPFLLNLLSTFVGANK